MASEAYPRGTVVLVPFPFTDLSGRKRRPALVVSPEGFSKDDLVLCAITSRVTERDPEQGVLLEPEDVARRPLPKRSIVRVGKLFTMNRSLVAARFGIMKQPKLREVLRALRRLFAEPGASGDDTDEPYLRRDEVDGAVLALLHLNAFEEKSTWRAWKTFDRDAMDRLHEKGFIDDPRSKARSVMLTDKGRSAAEEAFRRRVAAGR